MLPKSTNTQSFLLSAWIWCWKRQLIRKCFRRAHTRNENSNFSFFAFFVRLPGVVQKQKKRQNNNLASLQPRGDEEVVRQLLNDRDQRAVLPIGQRSCFRTSRNNLPRYAVRVSNQQLPHTFATMDAIFLWSEHVPDGELECEVWNEYQARDYEKMSLGSALTLKQKKMSFLQW